MGCAGYVVWVAQAMWWIFVRIMLTSASTGVGVEVEAELGNRFCLRHLAMNDVMKQL